MLMQSEATATSNRWLCYFKRNPKAGLRLFCFPYAGGNAMVYRSWSQKLPPNIEVVAIQLPGHGSRTQEPPLSSLPELVELLGSALAGSLNEPFAFFGHSMGALVAFELARLLRREGRALPMQMLVSGRTAPQLKDCHAPLYNRPKSELLQELRQLEGTPREVLEHPELMEYMLPILRADFSICDTYEYTEAAPLECPISVFGGLQDTDVPRQNLEGWREQTSSTFSLRMLPGNHFFLHSNETLLLNLLAIQLGQAI
jgi:medium-chain acyl-[acyl-carrier-protein] hydrolase